MYGVLYSLFVCFVTKLLKKKSQNESVFVLVQVDRFNKQYNCASFLKIRIQLHLQLIVPFLNSSLPELLPLKVITPSEIVESKELIEKNHMVTIKLLIK